MARKYTFGLIGAGMIAEEHAKNLNMFQEADVKWIAARIEDKGQLRKVSKKFGIPHTTTDYIEILEDKAVDAVIICTPPFTHTEIFKKSLENGKHILIEKPAAISKEQLQEMLLMSKLYSKLYVCDASCRHSRLQPKFRYVKDFIQSGRLGEVYYIHHNSISRKSRPGIEYHPGAKWFLDKSKSGGGLIIDWGVYDLSFHLGILNDDPEFISAINFTKSHLDAYDPGNIVFDVEEHFASMMKFTGGLNYYWERSAHSNMEKPDETRIYGTRGGIKFSYLSWESPEIKFYELDRSNKSLESTEKIPFTTHSGDGYTLIEHFLKVIQGKEKPAMPLELAAKHLEIIYENYQLAENKII